MLREGDSVEVFGNGPFTLGQITISGKSLRLRAVTLNGQRAFSPISPQLKGRSRPKCRVKGDIFGLALSRARLNVATPFSVGSGVAAFARRGAGHFIEGSLQPFGGKILTNRDRGVGLALVPRSLVGFIRLRWQSLRGGRLLT